jgi:hypothetical protein
MFGRYIRTVLTSAAPFAATCCGLQSAVFSFAAPPIITIMRALQTAAPLAVIAGAVVGSKAEPRYHGIGFAPIGEGEVKCGVAVLLPESH